MEQLTVTDIDFIIESLNYTKLNFENYPIGEKGYPSYEYKQERIETVNKVIQKMRSLKKTVMNG